MGNGTDADMRVRMRDGEIDGVGWIGLDWIGLMEWIIWDNGNLSLGDAYFGGEANGEW